MSGPFIWNTVPMSQIELSFACRNLKNRFSKSNPLIVVSMRNASTGCYDELQQTETLTNTSNPDFAKKIVIDYYLEECQKMRFEVLHSEYPEGPIKTKYNLLGRLECTLGEIVASPGGKIHRALTRDPGPQDKYCGSILISADELETSKVEIASLQFKAMSLDRNCSERCCCASLNTFLLIYRINDDKSETLVCRTDIRFGNLEPVWNPFTVTLRQLCSGNVDQPIRIECYDHKKDGRHRLIGSIFVTLANLKQNGAGTTYELVNAARGKKKGYKNSGVVELMQCNVQTKYSFLDYIRGGTQIHFSVAIDFTASNGAPENPNSLHNVSSFRPNQYMMALKAVGEICQDYSSDKLFPAFGFGAKLPNGEVSHLFNLNFRRDPKCKDISGVLEAYQYAIRTVQLYGPTNFAPSVNHVAGMAASSDLDGSDFFVLLIITDGIITDFEQTRTAIVNASSFPFAVIIVGVGDADFGAMDALDSDDKILTDIHGRPAEFDIVQFVPFRKFVHGENAELSQFALAKEVMFEIPGQLTAWMEKRRIKPKPPTTVDTRNLPVQGIPPHLSTSPKGLSPPGPVDGDVQISSLGGATSPSNREKPISSSNPKKSSGKTATTSSFTKTSSK